MYLTLNAGDTDTVTDLLYDCVSILLVEEAKYKMASNWKISVT